MRLAYTAPPECPDRDAFILRLAARAPNVRIAGEDDSAAPSAVADVRAEGSEFRGTLRVEGPAVPPSTRDVPGATCPDVADALALVLALSLAPSAETTAEAAVSPVPAAPAPAPPATAPPEEPAPPATPPSESTSRPTPLGRWLAGVEGRYLAGPAPDGMGTASVFVAWGSSKESPVSPVAELGALFGTRGAVAQGNGSVSFSATGLWLRGCPYRVRLGDTFALSPCATVDAFLLLVQASDGIPNAESNTRLWLAPGASVKLTLLALDPLRVELFGGVSVPVLRDRFYVRPDPGVTVHQTADVVGSAGLALAYRFR